MSDPSIDQQRNGRVVTFYSYKGGTGRTMALANVAWILASNGYRVLAADWDLESPGLHRFFAPFLDSAVRDAQGIIDMVRDYEWQAQQDNQARREGQPEREQNDETRKARIARHARIERFVIPLRHWAFPAGGTLDFLSPGRQNKDYLATLSALDWDNFYNSLNGGAFLDALREELTAHYDYALIDSRTGLSDIADICTVHLPDVLVDCFTLSSQAVDGAAQVAKIVEDLYGYRIRVLPVPMRVDPSEQERADAGRIYAQRSFEGLPTGLTAMERRAYWANVEVPYRPYYAYEEMLAVFGDMPGAPGSMLSAYERLTRYITDGKVTGLPPIEEDQRNITRAKFDRRPPLENRRIVIEYLPQDHIWVEWITAVLISGGFAVHERRLGQNAPDDGDALQDPRTLTVVSDSYLDWRRDHARRGAGEPRTGSHDTTRSPATRPGFAASVLSIPRPLQEFAPEFTIQLGSARTGDEAVDRLEQHFRLAIDADGRTAGLPRYPGMPPAQRGVGAPVGTFSGRERELRELREQLRSGNTAIVRPVALLGTAGMGKTAIALEYVHRYMNDYDLVGWIRCGHSAQVDTRIAELESVIQDRFGHTMPTDALVGERADAVLGVLGDGETVPRWLLVYDNAEDIDTVRRWLPSSGGRVLITSQSQDWADHARPLQVRKFERAESLAYLLHEVPQLDDEDAGRLADALDDMPLALAAVAPHLRDTGYPVTSFVSDIKHPRSPVTGSAYPAEVDAALTAPLALLRERSPAAFRLLQLCSVMAPEIGRALVYGNAMAENLKPLDVALVEPMIMRRVVKEASNLNLLTADPATGQIVMHRVVQDVVANRMTPEERDGARAEVRQILLTARPRRDVDDPATWSRYQLIWPHLEPTEVVASGDERVRQLTIDRIRYLNIFGDYARAVTEGNKAAADWERMLEAEKEPAAARTLRTQWLQLRSTIGFSLLGLSEFTKSRDVHQQVLEEQASVLGQEHPHTLMTAGGLAADLRALGQYRAALELDRQTHPSWVRQYGDDYLWSLRAANNLAVSERLNGHVRAAQDLDAQTHQRLRLLMPEGEGHALTLASARNLARDLIEAGDYRAAVDGALDAYKTAAEAMGPDSGAALDAQILLGIALRGAGKPAEAEPQFKEALRLLRARFGEAGSATLACRLSYSVNLLALDRFAEAEAEMTAVLAEYQRRLGPSHPHTLVCQVNLAATLRQQRAGDRAVAAIDTALAGFAEVLDPDHPYTLAAAMVQSVLLADRGDFEKAAGAEARTAATLARTLGPSHPDTLRCRANLLHTRRDLGEDTTAEYARLIAQLELLLGADHMTLATLRENRRVLRALDPQPF